MISFDDFDAWGEAVSGASLRLVCDAVEVPRWTLGILDLGGVVLQMATEGGGNLCYGVNAHAGPLLFVPLSHAAGHVVNGVRLDEESLFAIPRGADFSIHDRHRAHAWCSIALPDGSITAHPAKVDAIVQGAWRPVYHGQDEGHANIVAHVLAQYINYLCHPDTQQLPPITAERLLK